MAIFNMFSTWQPIKHNIFFIFYLINFCFGPTKQKTKYFNFSYVIYFDATYCINKYYYVLYQCNLYRLNTRNKFYVKLFSLMYENLYSDARWSSFLLLYNHQKNKKPWILGLKFGNRARVGGSRIDRSKYTNRNTTHLTIHVTGWRVTGW